MHRNKWSTKEAPAIYRRRGTSKSSITVPILSSIHQLPLDGVQNISKCSLILSSISQRRCCRRGCFSRASGHYRRRRRVSKAARTVVPVPTTRKHSHNPTNEKNCTLLGSTPGVFKAIVYFLSFFPFVCVPVVLSSCLHVYGPACFIMFSYPYASTSAVAPWWIATVLFTLFQINSPYDVVGYIETTV